MSLFFRLNFYSQTMKRCTAPTKCQVNDSVWGMGFHINMLLILPLKILLYILTASNTGKKPENICEKKVSFALYRLKVTSPSCHYSIEEQHHPHFTGKKYCIFVPYRRKHVTRFRNLGPPEAYCGVNSSFFIEASILELKKKKTTLYYNKYL